MALWVFFLFRAYSQSILHQIWLQNKVFVCFSGDIIMLLSFSYHAELKENFFLKSFVGPSQNVQQPKSTHYPYILVIYGRYLTTLISMYLFPCLYSICSCFFLGGGVVGWWGNTPVNPILHYSHILR